MKNAAIPLQTLEDTLNYLAGRPWIEVHVLIAQLQSCPAIPEPKPEDKEAPPKPSEKKGS